MNKESLFIKIIIQISLMVFSVLSFSATLNVLNQPNYPLRVINVIWSGAGCGFTFAAAFIKAIQLYDELHEQIAKLWTEVKRVIKARSQA